MKKLFFALMVFISFITMAQNNNITHIHLLDSYFRYYYDLDKFDSIFYDKGLDVNGEEKIVPYIHAKNSLTKTYIDNGPLRLSFFSMQFSDSTINEYEYVDLGLPSGLRWASYNIGADKPEGFGNRYAWGHTKPDGDTTGISIEDSINIIYRFKHPKFPIEFDAANAYMGKEQRVPTSDDYKELFENCTAQTNVYFNNVIGNLLTSKINGKKIFFPNLRPTKNGEIVTSANLTYGTSSLEAKTVSVANAINVLYLTWGDGSQGCSPIRAVSDKNRTYSISDTIGVFFTEDTFNLFINNEYGEKIATKEIEWSVSPEELFSLEKRDNYINLSSI